MSGDRDVIVVGTDGSDTSLRAVDKAAALAAEDDATLVIASAFIPTNRDHAGPDPDQPKHGHVRKDDGASVDDILRDASARAHTAGATRVDERAVEGVPADALAALAEEVGADLLVVGSVGLNSVVGRIFGSVPRQLLKHASTKVLVVDTTG